MVETIRHYFPDVDPVCLLMRGKRPSVFHDSSGCPIYERGDTEPWRRDDGAA